ncbi:MAG: sensor histidine kinase KdpD [Armatimonadetes bacterium]|nr:sensor histidine kinase KdpD [Armatimonadota bacterium]
MRARPDPDALLARLGHEEARAKRGRLKVYLGMAAGVGKTYSMLQAAQEDRKRGVEVVIGYLEPHGRAETEAMADGLERMPLKGLEHNGVTFNEFDVDAALVRRPSLLLVDELAHTNATGSRHKKRWQDVEELLRAGINVATTVNVQHLESLNDVVAQITGIRVAETVPDALVAQADEVELVDIPPEELVQRLREGKVYVPEKVEHALTHFFKRPNLLALRELALRHTAERVELDVRTARAAEGSVQPWATNERILVCIAPNKMGTRIVRAAKRMAGALHAGLIAVYVESPRQAALSDRDRLFASEAVRLAESLGAETLMLSGQDIAAEIVRAAQEHNATMIVVGKPVRPPWREFLFGSVVASIVRASGDIDVHVITGGDDLGTPIRLAPRTERHDWQGFATAVVVTALATVVNLLVAGGLSLVNHVMLYLLGVVFVAARHGRTAAVVASLLSVLAFDFTLVPPRWTFAVDDAEYLLTFVVMLVVGVLVSSLTSRLRDQSGAASDRERRTAALYDLSRKLSSTRSRHEIGDYAAGKVREVLGCDVAVLVRSRSTGKLFPAPESRSGFEKAANETVVAEWVLEHGIRAGRGTDTLSGAEGLYVPLNAESGCVGVMALQTSVAGEDPRQRHLLEAIASQLAVAIERTNLAKDSHEASIAVEQERLRNSLLSSVSHDLRSPLAVIAGAAESLASSPSVLGRDKELADAVLTEANRLERQVRNLLDMTRMESGTVVLDRQWQSLEELVGSAVERTEPLLGPRPLSVGLDPDMPLIEVDGVLIEQVFVNLLENAARHTLPTTHVWIHGSRTPGGVQVEFANDGPSIEGGASDSLFQRFQKGPNREGFGLGLAICKAIVDAHGGTITALDRSGGGVVFRIGLPVDGQPPEVPHG